MQLSIELSTIFSLYCYIMRIPVNVTAYSGYRDNCA